MVKLNKENLNNGKQQGKSKKQNNSLSGTEDERVRNIRRLYTTNDERIRPYSRRSNDGSNRRLVKYLYEPSETIKNEYKKLGWQTDSYYELELNSDEGAKLFAELSRKNLNVKKEWSKQVHLYSIEEYKDMRLFLSQNGTSGFAIKNDGDIVSVFSSKKGSSKAMLELAIQNGGRKLDCFDTYLPKMYK